MENQEPIQPIQSPPIQPPLFNQPLFHHPLSGTGQTRDILGFINAFMISDTILLRTEMSNETTDNRGVSEVFSNNLDEFTVDSEFAKKELQCSICLDDFKEGDKCIRLPCKGESHVFHSRSDNCSGVRPWLERNNTCPMCRHEFPKEETEPPLTPEQIAETIPNPNSLENTITDMIEEYIRNIDSLLTTEDNDLQRAIELSLND